MKYSGVITFGDLPPPVTGENLCRMQLEAVLREEGDLAGCFGKVWLFKVFGLAGSRVVIMARQSLAGTLSDWLLARCIAARNGRVWFYIHNRSWRRFLWLFSSLFFFGSVRRRVTLVVLTRDICEQLRAAGWRVSVLPNSAGLDFERMVDRLSVPRRRRLLWVGRPDASKGFVRALAILSALRQRENGWTLDVYGTDGVGLAKQDGVFYRGFVSGADKVRAFAGGGVFILPSRYENETQPLAIIEALAAGLPVVASDQGGIPEMLPVDWGRAGHCVVTDDIGDYVRAIEDCYEKYEEYSAAARRIFKKKYSNEIYAMGVRNVICEKES